MSGGVVLPTRAAVDRLRAALARDHLLYERRGPGRAAEWQRVGAAEPFDWNAGPALVGVKRFFFPSREPLLRWRGDAVMETLPDPAPFALVGLRACDLAAIAYLDAFFAGDAAYEARRRRALLVGVNCVAACAGGFCDEVDAGPFARGGFDLALTPLRDGRVVVDVGSAAGRVVVRSHCADAPAVDVATAREWTAAERDARATFVPRPFVGRAITRVDAASAQVAAGSTPATTAGDGAVHDAEWQALGRWCLACTGCTSLCPTCSCFTVVDEPSGDGGERVRYWDSCLLSGFQREASGHHPAPDPGDRVRRFWSHKLSREFAATCGRLGCVGCGRCDVACPGVIGASRVLAALGGERSP